MLNTVDRIEDPSKLALDPRGVRQCGEGALLFLDQNGRSIVTGITDASTENTTEALLSLERFALMFSAVRGAPKTVPAASTRTFAVGEIMPDGQLAGIGPGAALRNGPEFAKLTATSRGAYLRAKYGEIPGTVDQRINLRSAIAQQRDTLRASLTGGQRGPMVGGVMDSMTGRIFTGLNTELIGDVHPALAARLIGVTTPHGEIVALNKALWARGCGAQIDSSFLIYNMRFSKNFTPSMPRCPTCVEVSRGAFSLSDPWR